MNDKIENIEAWLRYKPTAKDYLKDRKIVPSLGTSLINIRSKHYHIEFVYDGFAYSSITKEGVRKVSISELNKEEYEVIIVKEVNINRAMEEFKKIEGHDYDWLGIVLCQIFNINRHHKYKEYCVEVFAKMLGLNMPHQFGMLTFINFLIDRNKIIDEKNKEAELIYGE